jgi:hypothetical protein
MMTPDEDMALKFAVVALRNALLKRAVLSQAEIDVELGDIFAKIAIDKTLGSTLLEGSGLNFAKVEHYARTILHPGYREEQSWVNHPGFDWVASSEKSASEFVLVPRPAKSQVSRPG